MKQITVKIELKHIENADMDDNTKCMAALALKDALSKCDSIVLGISSAYIQKGQLSYIVNLPEIAEQKIVAALHIVDMRKAAGLLMLPFSFEITVPDWAVGDEPPIEVFSERRELVHV